jgi:hypothetical protein
LYIIIITALSDHGIAISVNFSAVRMPPSSSYTNGRRAE